MIDLLNLGNTYVKYYKLIFGQYFKLPFLLGGGGGETTKKQKPKTKQNKKKTPNLSKLLYLFSPCWPLCKHMALMAGLGEKDPLC